MVESEWYSSSKEFIPTGVDNYNYKMAPRQTIYVALPKIW